MAFKRLAPRQPDPYIVKAPDQELAKFGHLNGVIGYVNNLQLQILGILGSPSRYNLTATRDPNAADNLSIGYTTDSIWYNTLTRTFWACTYSDLTTATWSDQIIGTAGVKNNMTATSAPTPGDDSQDGYSVNSGWYNRLTGLLYFAQSVNPGAADWAQVPVGPSPVIDVTWDELITLLANSALVPHALYHITNNLDTSTTLRQGWVMALANNQLAQTGYALITARFFTARQCSVGFCFSALEGRRISWVKDINNNHISPGDLYTTTMLDTWLNSLQAAAYQVQVYSAFISTNQPVPLNTGIGSGSVFRYGSSLVMNNGSYFNGIMEAFSTVSMGVGSSAAPLIGRTNVGEGSVYSIVDGLGPVNGIIGPGKNITSVGNALIFHNYSTYGNTLLQRDGLNATGDTVTILQSTGTLLIVDGSTDITIVMTPGIIDGQALRIIFSQAQTATTWSGSNREPSLFPASSVAPYKIETTWDATSSMWI